jgi:hypothetical protein
MNKKVLATTIIICLFVAGISFYAGLSYAKGKSVKNGQVNFTDNRSTGQVGAGRMMGQGKGNGSSINREILSKDDKSITIKLNDGGSRIAFFTASTIISKTTEGTKDDLENGKQVMVFGSANSDGSINMQNVQLRNSLAPQDIKK